MRLLPSTCLSRCALKSRASCSSWLPSAPFPKADFLELSDGHVRLRAPLTHELAEAMLSWSRAIAPWAESVAHALGRAMAGKYESSTPTTVAFTRQADELGLYEL